MQTLKTPSPPPGELIRRFLTPQAPFYVRSHGPVPQLRPDNAVEVTGVGVTGCSYTPEELLSSFAEHSVTAVMQCAGNRRTDFQEFAGTAGDPWDVGAIGNAGWTGVRLADVLAAVCTFGELAAYVAFTGADEVDVEGEVALYGMSIGVDKARDPDVLLAWAMERRAAHS